MTTFALLSSLALWAQYSNCWVQASSEPAPGSEPPPSANQNSYRAAVSGASWKGSCKTALASQGSARSATALLPLGSPLLLEQLLFFSLCSPAWQKLEIQVAVTPCVTYSVPQRGVSDALSGQPKNRSQT